MDDIARINRETFTREKAEGKYWTLPKLDLDVAAFAACRSGEGPLPPPFGDDPVDRMMMTGVFGKKILLLAGGGGQQSAVFSLLGASVTVLDLTPSQLEGDAAAAAYYGYSVDLIEGDMRDLSCLPSAHFDRVYQPPSIFCVPDLKEVFAGVYRLLKPAGLYFLAFSFPILQIANDIHWDGEAYSLRIASPYRRGAVLEDSAGFMSLSKGTFMGEFHHLFSDVINGLLESGFCLRGLWECPRPDSAIELEKLQPGSEEHQDQFIPYGLSAVVER
jgi:ubiquinone/menaquinone biosynthesis C-methylase UbiE